MNSLKASVPSSPVGAGRADGRSSGAVVIPVIVEDDKDNVTPSASN